MPAVVSLGARAVVRLAWYPASLHLLPCTCANVLSNSLSIMVVPFCLHKRDNLVWYKLVWIPQGSHTVYLDNEWLRCNFLDKLLFLLVRISPCGQFKLFVEIVLSHLYNCTSTEPGLNVSDLGTVTRSCLPSWWSFFLMQGTQKTELVLESSPCPDVFSMLTVSSTGCPCADCSGHLQDPHGCSFQAVSVLLPSTSPLLFHVARQSSSSVWYVYKEHGARGKMYPACPVLELKKVETQQ